MSLNGDELAPEFKDTEESILQVTIVKNETNPPNPRLCHLKKWPHFQGYGFNLHAERAKTGQHIGKVDADSPAESAGLKEGDRIIEVNNVNISNENHQQVVKRIRNGLEKNGKFYDNQVLLLVLDNEADLYYRNLNVIVKSNFKNVQRIMTKMPDGLSTDTEEEGEDLNNNVTEFSNQNNTDNLKTLSDTTNIIQHEKTSQKTNSLSSISQKSMNSNSNNSYSNLGANLDSSNVVVHQNEHQIVKQNQPNNNENIMDQSVTSLANKSSNRDVVSSASNMSLSSNNQSNSSKVLLTKIKKKWDIIEHLEHKKQIKTLISLKSNE